MQKRKKIIKYHGLFILLVISIITVFSCSNQEKVNEENTIVKIIEEKSVEVVNNESLDIVENEELKEESIANLVLVSEEIYGNFALVENASLGIYYLYYTPDETHEKIITFSNKSGGFNFPSITTTGIYVFDNGSIMGILCDISERYNNFSLSPDSSTILFFADGNTGKIKIENIETYNTNIMITMKENHSELFLLHNPVGEDTKTIYVINNKGEYTNTFEFESKFWVDTARITEEYPNIYLLNFINIEYDVNYRINLNDNSMKKFSESYIYW